MAFLEWLLAMLAIFIVMFLGLPLLYVGLADDALYVVPGLIVVAVGYKLLMWVDGEPLRRPRR